ncbi:MAG: alpha/beta hydrolase [Amaricoccus sp.]|uniref:alpha/beta hydrolase n=1 Tax=Amaricoccus sp. TaxID=1872485 RepID=UPI0039E2F446
MAHDLLDLPDGRRIAYRLRPGASPTVVFLGGFRSDMTGTKADCLDGWAAGAGLGFLRFDYTGHGASSGRFEDGAIGDWVRDAAETIGRLTRGPLVLVGSSMGGWIALRLVAELGLRVAGLVGIAAAPDFTEDSMWAAMDAAIRERLIRDGRVEVPSDHEAPYPITRRLIEDGRENLVLRSPLRLPFPVRLLHGTADTDVAPAVALRLLAHAEGPDIRLTLVKGADHRFSSPEALALLTATVAQVVGTPSA